MTLSAANPSLPCLSAKAIDLTFGDQHPVVTNFNLQVRRREIVSIVGPSGVGKSSVLRVLAGLQRPAAGVVMVGETACLKPNPKVALAFQSPALLPWLTVRQNVAFGLDFKSQQPIPRAARELRINHALAEVGLTNAASKYPSEISGGMAQRAALARCLAREPDVLLLDEPFGALDEITRQSMQALLLAARERHQMAVVLVTHDIDEALLVSDRIGLLAGAPAQITHQWQLGPTASLQQRDLLCEKMVSLRVDILKALRDSTSNPLTPDSTASVATPALNQPNQYPQEYAHVL